MLDAPDVFVAVPDIEEHVPLPRSATDALPELSPQEEILMRARTIQLLSEITGQAIAPTVDNQAEAVKLAKQMTENPAYRPQFTNYPNETMAYLAGMVAQSNTMLVEELADLKLYVVNKLIWEVEHAKDSKSRVASLRLLGEVDGVDAFKRRTETTISVKPITEVEQELMNILTNVEYRLVNPLKTVSGPVSEHESASNEQENDEIGLSEHESASDEQEYEHESASSEQAA
jgi:type IV secretory pathway VirJ component